ncbi:ParA family protein [Aeromonas enteropelogenes]|uniref:ParA family protein n=1 Tax=Aeromonas enteropelogenes TaxID=29489 RepID=UPI003B9E3F7D
MAKSICFFNHKGGVSKTTTTFNLGWVLASSGYKVMMVDLDSQCNLTGMSMGFNQVQEANLEQFYLDRNNLHMGLVVDFIISGGQPGTFLTRETGSLQTTKNPNLYLLAGNIGVSELDQQISVSLKVSAGIPATRNIPGHLPRIISEIAQENSIDYVLYDLSPNIGGLNQIALMSSDYFVVPTSPDFFCWQAISSLATHIPKWHEELRLYKLMSNRDTSVSIKNSPLFLGTLHQRYRPRNGSPAASFQDWIDKIRTAVDQRLVTALDEIQCVIPRESVEMVNHMFNNGDVPLTPYDLAQISDFNSLIAISQANSTPVFELTEQQIRDAGQFGHALNTMMANRDSFLESFNALGNKIIELTQ